MANFQFNDNFLNIFKSNSAKNTPLNNNGMFNNAQIKTSFGPSVFANKQIQINTTFQDINSPSGKTNMDTSIFNNRQMPQTQSGGDQTANNIVEKSITTKGNQNTAYMNTSNWETTTYASGKVTKTSPDGNITITYAPNGMEIGGEYYGEAFETSYVGTEMNARRKFSDGHSITYDTNGNEISGSDADGEHFFISNTDNNGHIVRTYYKVGDKPGHNNIYKTEICDSDGFIIESNQYTHSTSSLYRVNQDGSAENRYSDFANDQHIYIQYNSQGKPVSENINGLTVIHKSTEQEKSYAQPNTTEQSNTGAKTNIFDTIAPDNAYTTKAMPETTEISKDASTVTKGSDKPNGKIDEPFNQMYEGDCWALSAINSIMREPGGMAYLNSLVSYNSTNDTVTVKLPGVGESVSFPASELESEPYSSLAEGDRDVRAIEIAMDKYLTDINYQGRPGFKSRVGSGGHENFAWKILMPKGNKAEIREVSRDKPFDVRDFNSSNTMYTATFDDNCYAIHPDGSKHKLTTEHAFTVVKSDSKYVYVQDPHGSIDPKKTNFNVNRQMVWFR